MNCEKLTNTTALLPDREVRPGEVIENVQICPIGDFPNVDRQQHCTAEALQNVVKEWAERGSKEILVDFEHLSESHEPNSDTSAAAWVSNVRVDPERGHSGTVTFSVERIFERPELATEYALVTLLAEETEGALTVGDNEVFAHAAVTNRTAAQVGCAVAVSYTIEG